MGLLVDGVVFTSVGVTVTAVAAVVVALTSLFQLTLPLLQVAVCVDEFQLKAPRLLLQLPHWDG
jgi:hypothetical protein